MRQAVTTMILGFSLALVHGGLSRGDEADVPATIDRARRLMQANDHSSAVGFLEEALLEANANDRSTIVDLLRQAYEVLARQADSAGRSRDAAHYRDNLAILNRGREKPTAAKTPAESPKTPTELPKRSDQPKPPPHDSGARLGASNETPRILPIKALLSDLVSQVAPPNKPDSEAPPLSEPLDPRTEQPPSSERSSTDMGAASDMKEPTKTESESEPNANGLSGTNLPAADASPSTRSQPDPDVTPAAPNASLELADRLFAGKRYDEAGRSYAALARQNRLPADRTEHWAYCRWVEVVRRINARPDSAQEWDEIDSEVRSIQQLTPKSWYGDYLRNKVAEVRRSRPRLFGKARAVVPSRPSPSAQRAAAMDPSQNDPGPTSQRQNPNTSTGVDRVEADSVAPTLSGRSQPTLDANVKRAGDESAATGSWQVHETANFRIFHRDDRLAEAASEAAESVRAIQAKRWSSPSAQRDWAPRCEIYLYPTGEMLAQATGQPDTSPGFSAMEVNGNRIVARKIHLRANHAQMKTAILPHEVTHVVMADLFIAQPIPRWADEGIAVLAEPRAEQRLKAADLREALESGRIFPLDKLMAMDYPDAKDWSTYYAQSVSLTRFLSEQRPPESFVRFVRTSQQKGVDVALREVYQIGGTDVLQQRWLEYARRQLSTIGTSTADAAH